MTLDGVLFDLDDTLHDDTLAFTAAAEEVAREVAAEHGIDALVLKDAYVAEAEAFWHRLTPAELTTKLGTLRTSLWAAALRRVGLFDGELAERSATNYHAYRNRRLELFPGTLDLLRDVRARGMKLGLVTNGFVETHREKIALLRLGEAFDAIFIADEVGMVKPDPRLFAHACAKLHTAPARTAMVGDRYERDIAGAAAAGLQTIWIKQRGDVRPDGAPAPTATVAALGQVRQVLLGETSASGARLERLG